jgi:cardiolipin synthase
VLVTTSRHTTISQEALRLIEQAQTEILVSSYGLSADHDVVKSLVRKARSGVPVMLVTRPRPAVQPAVSALCAAGARVLAHDKLHAKAIVTDAGAMIMSANLEASGLDHGFEVGVRLTDAEATSLRSVLSTWAERFPWQFESNAPRTRHLGEICLADRGLRDGRRQVIEEAVVHLEAVTADDALRLDATLRPALKEPSPDEYPQRVRYEWQVRPPTLPRKAKQRLREIEETRRDKDGKEKVAKLRVPFEPPVHEHAGQTYVVLRQESDKEVVRRLADELGAKVVLP